MDEYLCVTLTGNPGEAEAAFKARLTDFWTRMLRTKPDDYEKVYAEATEFEPAGDVMTRRYLVEATGVPALIAALIAADVGFLPVDADDLYSKYEAGSSDWFQIEH